MRIVFRVDASLQIGTGHVMRCLTLANRLKETGCECYFICREHNGNLIDYIKRNGHNVYSLPGARQTLPDTPVRSLKHADWLGTCQEEDATQCLSLLTDLTPNWLIVDHYALDAQWERMLSSSCQKLMVIDDLADRPHVCNLLLDQTFGRDQNDYRHLVPGDCVLLCGSEYALLRPEFSQWRKYSLERRKYGQFKKLLITMGGVDQHNATGQVLRALKSIELPPQLEITVVMGPAAPWLEDVRQFADCMPGTTQVLVNVANMAELMANSDLAIGAAGATSWERCCLGMPAVLFVLAENQLKIALELSREKAVWIILPDDDKSKQLGFFLKNLTDKVLLEMSQAARKVVQGYGTKKVLEFIESN